METANILVKTVFDFHIVSGIAMVTKLEYNANNKVLIKTKQPVTQYAISSLILVHHQVVIFV